MPLLSVGRFLPLRLPEAQPETWWFKPRPVGWNLGGGVQLKPGKSKLHRNGRRRHPGTAAPVKRALVALWTGQCGEGWELSLARDAAGCGLDELHIYRLSNLC